MSLLFFLEYVKFPKCQNNIPSPRIENPPTHKVQHKTVNSSEKGRVAMQTWSGPQSTYIGVEEK